MRRGEKRRHERQRSEKRGRDEPIKRGKSPGERPRHIWKALKGDPGDPKAIELVYAKITFAALEQNATTQGCTDPEALQQLILEAIV